MRKTYEGKTYDVSETSKNNMRIRSYKPVIPPDEKKRHSEYVTRLCVQILKIRG